MVDVAQLVRATDCGSVGRGFETHLPPKGFSYKGNPFFIYLSNNIGARYVVTDQKSRVKDQGSAAFLGGWESDSCINYGSDFFNIN